LILGTKNQLYYMINPPFLNMNEMRHSK
jgi:hypothetical protein